jgi:hypothetical protein
MCIDKGGWLTAAYLDVATFVARLDFQRRQPLFVGYMPQGAGVGLSNLGE